MQAEGKEGEQLSTGKRRIKFSQDSLPSQFKTLGWIWGEVVETGISQRNTQLRPGLSDAEKQGGVGTQG